MSSTSSSGATPAVPSAAAVATAAVAASTSSQAATTSAAAVGGDERQAFAKLEALKEIRGKTIALEKLRLRLMHDVDSIESEDKCQAEYRREMELLQQEKMAHVEELRQIHADINAMETVMKQAEEAKRQSVDSARRIIDDYAPLKHEVDLMRVELLGLEKLPDISAEERDKMGAMGLLEKPKQSSVTAAAAAMMGLGDPAHPWHHPPGTDPNKPYGAPGGISHFAHGTAAAGAGAAAGGREHAAAAAAAAAAHAHNPFLAAAAQQSAMGLGPLGLASAAKADQLRTSLTAQAPPTGPVVPPAFRYVLRTVCFSIPCARFRFVFIVISGFPFLFTKMCREMSGGKSFKK